MRFSRIGLLRYGALTDTALTFRSGAALHIVYGPNEAGKSSALAAISDLLFGFPERTEQGFLHDARDLRISAELSARDGRSLAFRRRKGRKNTLLADEDTEGALPDDALMPFVGGLDRAVFERAFGLNSERLRRGADEMLKAGGEIGSLLFSAASGMMGLTRLRRSLDAEAEGIFAPKRAAGRSFYQVLDRHEQARRAERESELKSAHWKRLVAGIASVEAELDVLRKEREETRHALARLETLRQLAPLIGEIDGELAALGAYEALGALPAGFAQTLSDALQKVRAAAADEEREEKELAALTAALAALRIDEKLLAEEAAITARFAETGACLKTRQDLPRVEAEADDFDRRLANDARRLGLDGEADLEKALPPDTVLARLRGLLEEARSLANEREHHAGRLVEERDYLRALERKESGRLVDPAPFRERLGALRPELDHLSRLESLAVQRDRLANGLHETASRLRPSIRDVDRLAAMPLPDEVAIAGQRRSLDGLDTERREAERALAALEADLADVTATLRSLESGTDIVTREDIAVVRRERDGLLESLKTGDRSAAAVGDLTRLVARADELADRMLADAERVSRHAALRLRAGELGAAKERAVETLAAASGQFEAAREAYRALFADCDVVPLAPDAMLEWRRGVEGLLKERERLQALQDELEALKRRDAGLRPMLEDMAETLGLAGYDDAPLSVLHRGLEQAVADLSQRFLKAKGREEELRSVREKIAALEERGADLGERHEAFRRRFSEACLAIGLGEDAEPVMVEAALDLWREVPVLLAERDNRRRRVRGMRRDLETFEREVAALVGTLAPDLASLSADAAIDMLHRRAGEAKAAGERQRQLRQAIGEASARLESARLSVTETGERMAALLPEGGDADDLLRRLEERERLRQRLAESRARLAAHADGMDEAAIRRALDGFDRVAAGLEIERLQAADTLGVERFSELNVRLADLRREREALEKGVGAERAALERLSAETEAKDLARRWVVLRLASGLLGATMETYREKQADPVMRRAGELFSGITGGRFRRLVQLYDENDALQLLAERAGGEQVPLTGLSEGTGDQLYLALRLAFIEDFASRNEPVPLIADDIFQTFDEERTAAGLTTLAGTGPAFQTILFTHQKSVVDAAVRLLGDEADIVRFSPD
ncbi:AAA family ATPase [Rhizobiaceae bacterium BDR2-2]|uniref:AAA family ATPase n=1 Tax=Ectorhizobium quercum TaxID=2965071 RepID=A0AAE3SXD1_9HYPH|nr:YhaN family protein [Ectorhizobium quercum]MCX8998934.1 AAA family ATPase [Ectorhizobium quercum]